jgi:hypothetical protein
MHRLVWIHAGRKPIMLVLSWRGSFYIGSYNCYHVLNKVVFGFSDNTTTTTTTTPKPTLKPTNSPPDLPDVGESEKEHKSSLTIFFILLVIGEYEFFMFILINLK